MPAARGGDGANEWILSHALVGFKCGKLPPAGATGRRIGPTGQAPRGRGFGYAEATSAGRAMIVAPERRVPFRGTASFRHRPHTRRVLTIKTHGPAETAKGTAGTLCRVRSQTALFDPLTLAPGRRITTRRSAEWASLTASLYHDHPSTVL